MNQHPPRTAAEFMALSEGPGERTDLAPYGSEFLSEDRINSVYARDGICWILGRYWTGEWFRTQAPGPSLDELKARYGI